MEIFQLRMRRAALKQLLRDQSNWMTQDVMDEILDKINILTTLIEILEKKGAN